jgi:hypothetical protein
MGSGFGALASVWFDAAPQPTAPATNKTATN